MLFTPQITVSDNAQHDAAEFLDACLDQLIEENHPICPIKENFEIMEQQSRACKTCTNIEYNYVNQNIVNLNFVGNNLQSLGNLYEEYFGPEEVE